MKNEIEVELKKEIETEKKQSKISEQIPAIFGVGIFVLLGLLVIFMRICG